MRSLALMLVASFAAACGGGPILQNAPRPDQGVLAAIAAGAAGAATIANPAAAGRPKEKENVAAKKTVKTTSMPSDVLDRLDAAEQRADAGSILPP